MQTRSLGPHLMILSRVDYPMFQLCSIHESMDSWDNAVRKCPEKCCKIAAEMLLCSVLEKDLLSSHGAVPLFAHFAAMGPKEHAGMFLSPAWYWGWCSFPVHVSWVSSLVVLSIGNHWKVVFQPNCHWKVTTSLNITDIHTLTSSWLWAPAKGAGLVWESVGTASEKEVGSPTQILGLVWVRSRWISVRKNLFYYITFALSLNKGLVCHWAALE